MHNYGNTHGYTYGHTYDHTYGYTYDDTYCRIYGHTFDLYDVITSIEQHRYQHLWSH